MNKDGPDPKLGWIWSKHFARFEDDDEDSTQEKLQTVTLRDPEEMEEKPKGPPNSIAEKVLENTGVHEIVVLGSQGVGKTAITAQVIRLQIVKNFIPVTVTNKKESSYDTISLKPMSLQLKKRIAQTPSSTQNPTSWKSTIHLVKKPTKIS